MSSFLLLGVGTDAAVGGGGGYANAETTTWVNAVNTAAGASVVGTTRGNLVDTMITGMKSDGVFTLLDYLWIHALADENINEGLIDIKATKAATKNGTGTLDANGWTGDGSTGYLDTGIVLPSHFTVAGGSTGAVGSAVLNNRTTVSAARSIGVHETFDTHIVPLNTGSVTEVEVAGATYPSVANTGTKGFWIARRNTSTTLDLYKNGSTTPIINGVADNAGACGAQHVFIGADNNAGGGVVAGTYSTDQLVANLISQTGTATQMAAIMNRVNTLLTNLPVAKNVY